MTRGAIRSAMKFRALVGVASSHDHRGPPRRTPTEKHITSLETPTQRLEVLCDHALFVPESLQPSVYISVCISEEVTSRFRSVSYFLNPEPWSFCLKREP